MMTSFILLHDKGEPLLINIRDISSVMGNEVNLISQPGMAYSVDESFSEINNEIVDELQACSN